MGDDGRALLLCRSQGCSVGAICARLGLAPSALFADDSDRRRGGGHRRPGGGVGRRLGSGVSSPGGIVGAAAELEAYVAGAAERLQDPANQAARDGLDYLVHRFGIDRAMARELQLGIDDGLPASMRPAFIGKPFVGCPRLIVPFFVNGSLTGLQGRTLGDQEPRWASPKTVPLLRWGRVAVFALDRWGPVVVSESPGSAWRRSASGSRPSAFGEPVSARPPAGRARASSR